MYRMALVNGLLSRLPMMQLQMKIAAAKINKSVVYTYLIFYPL